MKHIENVCSNSKIPKWIRSATAVTAFFSYSVYALIRIMIIKIHIKFQKAGK